MKYIIAIFSCTVIFTFYLLLVRYYMGDSGSDPIPIIILAVVVTKVWSAITKRP